MRSKPETPTGRLQHVTGIAMKRTADVIRGVGVERTKRPKNWVLGHWVLRRAESGWSLRRQARMGVCVSWKPHEGTGVLSPSDAMGRAPKIRTED